MADHHYIVALAAAVLTAFGQMLLKRGSTYGSGRSLARLWLNAFTMAGYVVLLAVTLMNLYAFKVVPLRANVVLAPLQLLLVLVLSVTFFRERLSGRQVAACALIVIGIAIFNV